MSTGSAPAGRAGTGAVLLLSDDRLLWFVTRGSGVVVVVLVTASMVLGVLSTSRTMSRQWPRFMTQALHRNIAVLALALVIAHATVAVLDGTTGLRPIDVAVPFRTTRLFWGSLGTVAFDLMLFASLTSVARHRFGPAGWRVVHVLTYLAWPVALAHGLGLGTDRRTPWSVGVTAVCAGLVIGAVCLRIGGLLEDRRARSASAARPARPVRPARPGPARFSK